MKIRMVLISLLALTLVGCSENAETAKEQEARETSSGPVAVQMELTEAEKNFMNFAAEEPDPAKCTKPSRPESFKTLVNRDMLTLIYKKLNYERIAKTGTCSCDTLHPSFDEAVAEFNTLKPVEEDTEAWVSHKLENTQRRRAVEDRVKAICDAVELKL